MDTLRAQEPSDVQEKCNWVPEYGECLLCHFASSNASTTRARERRRVLSPVSVGVGVTCSTAHMPHRVTLRSY